MKRTLHMAAGPRCLRCASRRCSRRRRRISRGLGHRDDIANHPVIRPTLPSRYAGPSLGSAMRGPVTYTLRQTERSSPREDSRRPSRTSVIPVGHVTVVGEGPSRLLR